MALDKRESGEGWMQVKKGQGRAEILHREHFGPALLRKDRKPQTHTQDQQKPYPDSV